MPWKVRLLPDHPVIETCYTGRLTPEELATAIRETTGALRTHKVVRLLGDCRELEGGHSVVDLYYLAETMLASGLPVDLKEAVLLPVAAGTAGMAENVKFWETACFNRGFCVRVFENRNDAVAWLME